MARVSAAKTTRPAPPPARAPEPATNTNDPTKSSDVVMVACKLPHGLVLELITPGDGRKPLPAGKRYTLRGANTLRVDRRAAQGDFPFALTPIPRDFWNEWLKRNADMAFVVNGLVFASASVDKAEGQAKEHAGEKVGMEALNMEGDERLKSIGKLNGKNVEIDPDSVARAQSAPT